MDRLPDRRGRVWALAYSPDGRSLASGGEDKTVRVWDLAGRTETAVLKGHEGRISALAFSPDGTLLASAGGRGELFLWDLRTGTYDRFSRPTDRVAGVAFSPDGLNLVSVIGNVTEWSHSEKVTLWDVKARKKRVTRPVSGEPWVVAFDRTGRQLAVGAGMSGDPRIWLWGPGSGPRGPFEAKMTRLGGATPAVRDLAFSPDGSSLATTAGRVVRVWDLQTRQAVHTFEGHTHAVSGVAYARDGRQLVSGSEDGLVKVWDSSSGAEVRSFDWEIGKVRAVAVAPDGLTCAAAGDGAVVLWDTDGE